MSTRHIQRILKTWIASAALVAIAATVTTVLSNNAKAQQVPVVTVSIHTASSTLVSELQVQAATAIDATLAALDHNNIAYETNQDRTFLRSINGQQNWLYSVNDWTPPCTAMSEMQLQGGDQLIVYAMRHQYAAPTRIHTTAAPKSQGDNWQLQVESRDPITSYECDKPSSVPAWTTNNDIPVTVTDPTGSQTMHRAIQGSLTIEANKEGWYTAQIFAQGYMPSAIQSAYVARAQQGGDTNNQQTPKTNSGEGGEQNKQNDSQGNPKQPEAQNPQSQHDNNISIPAPVTNRTQHLQQQRANEQGQAPAATTTHTGTDAEPAPSTQSSATETSATEHVRQGTSLVNNEAGRAAQYLLQNRDTNGLIGGPETNSWALLGLVATLGPNNEQVQSVLNSHKQYLGSVQDLSVLEVEKQLILAAALNENPKNFAGINIEERFNRYYNEGQFGDPSALNDDIWALIAMHALGVPNEDNRVQGTRRYLVERQGDDGGFSHTVGQASDSDDTAAAIVALVQTGSLSSDPAITKALAFLDSTVDQNTNLVRHTAQPTEPSAVSAAWALQAYRMTGRPAPVDIAFGLKKLQAENGAVAYGNEQSVFATALAATALANKDFSTTTSLGPLKVRSVTEEAQEGSADTIGEYQEGKASDTGSQAKRSADVAGSTGQGSEETSQVDRLRYTIEQQKNQAVLLKRMNTILIASIIAMGVGIAIYGTLFHTNIGRAYRFE